MRFSIIYQTLLKKATVQIAFQILFAEFTSYRVFQIYSHEHKRSDKGASSCYVTLIFAF